jgi:hypothetical protein
MDIKSIRRFTRQLGYAYFLIALNVVSAIFFVIFSLCILHPKLRLIHACFHGLVDILNVIMLVYLQPWKIVYYLRQGFEAQRGLDTIQQLQEAKDAN